MTADNNPFTRMAESMMTAPTRKRAVKVVQSERDAPMKPSAQEQELIDREKLLRGYRAAKKLEFKLHLEGPDGVGWIALRDQLDSLSVDNAWDLPLFVERQQWLMQGSMETKRDALSIIAAAIIVLRLENGLPPIDDSLPGEEMGVFEAIREQLGVITP